MDFRLPQLLFCRRTPVRLAPKKHRLYWHRLHPTPGTRRDPGRPSRTHNGAHLTTFFSVCQLPIMSNFQLGDFGVGNRTPKTSKKARFDPRLVVTQLVHCCRGVTFRSLEFGLDLPD